MFCNKHLFPSDSMISPSCSVVNEALSWSSWPSQKHSLLSIFVISWPNWKLSWCSYMMQMGCSLSGICLLRKGWTITSPLNRQCPAEFFKIMLLFLCSSTIFLTPLHVCGWCEAELFHNLSQHSIERSQADIFLDLDSGNMI